MDMFEKALLKNGSKIKLPRGSVADVETRLMRKALPVQFPNKHHYLCIGFPTSGSRKIELFRMMDHACAQESAEGAKLRALCYFV
jgi:hypothetical protein